MNPLTEPILQFNSTEEVKRWLTDQTASILTPVQAQAKKLRDDMNQNIQALTEVSKLLFDNSTKEIEKRNMKVYNRARALNKLARLFLDRLKKLEPPQQVSYDSINRYSQEVQKNFMVTEIDIKNWFPRISPFFIMDRREIPRHLRTRQTSLQQPKRLLNQRIHQNQKPRRNPPIPRRIELPRETGYDVGTGERRHQKPTSSP